jgi:hypothetical protein
MIEIQNAPVADQTEMARRLALLASTDNMENIADKTSDTPVMSSVQGCTELGGLELADGHNLSYIDPAWATIDIMSIDEGTPQPVSTTLPSVMSSSRSDAAPAVDTGNSLDPNRLTVDQLGDTHSTDPEEEEALKGLLECWVPPSSTDPVVKQKRKEWMLLRRTYEDNAKTATFRPDGTPTLLPHCYILLDAFKLKEKVTGEQRAIEKRARSTKWWDFSDAADTQSHTRSEE